jgi:hypothetical protein
MSMAKTEQDASMLRICAEALAAGR